MKDNNTIIENEIDFWHPDVQNFESKNHKMLAEKWIEKGNKSYRKFVTDCYLNDLWNNLSENQKTEIALKAHGDDTPMKRIITDVDGISSYSCISKITKKYFQSH